MLQSWLRRWRAGERTLLFGARRLASSTIIPSSSGSSSTLASSTILPTAAVVVATTRRTFATAAKATPKKAAQLPLSSSLAAASAPLTKTRKGGLKPKKKKGKRPSVTAAYLKKREEQLAKHEVAAKQADLPWLIVAASIVERLPIIMKEPEAWEAAYMEMQEEIARHGKAFPKELDVMGQANEMDRPDAEILPELPFKLAPRVTKADRLNDRTTLNRALSERLFLLVKGPITGDRWDLPMAVLGKGGKDGRDSMRRTHEATVGRFLGEKFEAYMPSNAPVGMHWRVPAATAGASSVGAGGNVYGEKVFFYRAQHLKGRGRVVEEGVEEFVWVTREEVGEYLPQETGEEKEYAQLVMNVL
ncbi:39s ribosomal protein mitochondrial [Nannochloropsis oceanica]